MNDTPHSLLDAAKLTAHCAGLDWAIAHRYYRGLQGAGRSDAEVYWLPKSLGRNIWHAHPNYLARLLIAIGMTDEPELACAIVTFVAEFTPDGRERWLAEQIENHVEHALAKLLYNPIEADSVDRVEFDPVELSVDVRYRDGRTSHFRRPGTKGHTELNATIYRRGIIPGAVFSGLSRSVHWRIDAPLAKVPDGTVDPDA